MILKNWFFVILFMNPIRAMHQQALEKMIKKNNPLKLEEHISTVSRQPGFIENTVETIDPEKLISLADSLIKEKNDNLSTLNNTQALKQISLGIFCILCASGKVVNDILFKNYQDNGSNDASITMGTLSLGGFGIYNIIQGVRNTGAKQEYVHALATAKLIDTHSNPLKGIDVVSNSELSINTNHAQ